jgi:catechol 2,3-dioxygenase-like lactoylglutathione lyase family enzyme
MKNLSRETKMSVSFRTDGNVAIYVPDLVRAEGFYVGVLGFRLLKRSPEQLELDTGTLRLYVNLEKVNPRPFIPALEVRDSLAAKEHLRGAGCRIVQEGPDGKAFTFEDPFGLVLEVVQKRRASAGGDETAPLTSRR